MQNSNSVSRVDSVLPPMQRSKSYSRTQTVRWDESFTQNWRTVVAAESLDQRVDRYMSYLAPSHNQLSTLTKQMQAHLAPLENKPAGPHSVLDMEFQRMGEAYAVDLGSKTILAVRITKTGKDIQIEEACTHLVTAERDLTTPNTSAFELFEAISETIAQLSPPASPPTDGTSTPIAFVCSFDVDVRSKTSMLLNRWSKGLQTGRKTDDPVEGSDMGAMLECALRRNRLPYRIYHCMGDLIAAGVLAMCQLNSDQDNSVRFLMNLGTGFNVGALVVNNGVMGDVVDVKINKYESSIPRADFDLEVDWADGNTNADPLEKLVAGKYLGEIARRVILKCFHADAPKLAWSKNSLPTDAVERIATDDSPHLSVTAEIIKILWDWDLPNYQVVHIQKICSAVFLRSASIVACALCATAKSYNGLIPALGGSIIAVSGSLYNSSQFYRGLVRQTIDDVLGPILSKLLILGPVKGGSAVGAAMINLQKD